MSRSKKTLRKEDELEEASLGYVSEAATEAGETKHIRAAPGAWLDAFAVLDNRRYCGNTRGSRRAAAWNAKVVKNVDLAY